MATESLIIELDAKTAKLDARLKTTEEKLEKLNDQTKKNDSSFKKFGGVAISAAKSLAVVATAALAVGTAITAMTLKAASSRKELESFARQAKTTAEDFQALSFATSQYGINAEKIADISKDISDKVGEFAAAGTGTFQDYADVMKLTKEEARTLAIEFQSLSSEEVIGKMVSEMEAAGTSGAQMTFVLESMGSDLSTLLPLYQGNSKELLTLKKRFSDVNDSLQITGIQAEKLKAVSTTYGLLTSQLGNAATAVSATIAPVMDDFFNDIIAVVPDATQSIIDFINTFLDAENITSVGAVNKQIKITKEEIEATTALMETQIGRMAQSSQFQLDADTRRLEELEAQLVVLQDQEVSLENANRLKGGSIDGDGGEVAPLGTGTGDEIQAIADRFKAEDQLLFEKLERELVTIGDNNDLKLQLEDQYLMDSVLLEQKAEDEKAKATAEAAEKAAKAQALAAKSKMALEKSVANNAISLAQMVLGDSKAAALAGIVIQKAQALSANSVATAAGATAAFAAQQVPGDPTSFARGTAAAASMVSLGSINAGLIVATGLGQAAALGGGGGGGGSLSSGGGGFSGGNTGMGTNAPQQQNFEAEMSGLEIDDASSQGSGVQTIRFAVDSGDELIDAISNALNKANNEGR